MIRHLVIVLLALALSACGGDNPSKNNGAGDEDDIANNVSDDGGSTGDDGGVDMGTGDTGDQNGEQGDMGRGDDMAPGVDGGPDADPQPDMNTMMPLTDPALPGDLDTEIATETADIERESIDLTIHLPVGAGPYPIVVFHHGFQLGPDQYTSYGEHLASHGYVVVMPAMPGGAFGGPTHAELGELLVGVMDWIVDDVAADGTIGGVGDATNLALAGHSLGGKISLLTAVRDDRPVAVFGVDPVDSAPPFTNDPEAYPSVAPELMPDVAVPVGFVGETVDSMGGGFGMACAPADENFQQYYMAATSPAVEVEIVGADHMDFLDDPDCGFTCSACGPGSVDESKVQMYTRRYMTAFFDLYLQGSDASRTWLAGPKMEADEATGEVASRSKNGF